MNHSLEEMASLVEKLGSMLRGIMTTKKEEVPPGGALIEVENDTSGEAVAPEAEAVKPESNGEVNKSELVRSYFKKHGTDVRNKEVIEGIKKESGIEVAASMVSFIKSKLPEKGKSEKKEASKKPEASKVWTSKAVSGSSLIRDYLEERGLESSNDDVVSNIKKTKGIDVKPTLVSSVRAMLKRKGHKTSKVATVKVAARKSLRKGPTMPAVVVEVLKKAPKEGMELSEVTLKALKSGYKYRGKKDIQGLTQNVYQALHTLSKKILHPGYKGKTAIVIHEGRRYKLNPKAIKSRVA
jgi:hypothetical protein